MHTFLLTLEHLLIKHNNVLPDTVYYQIDGGSENTAKVMLGLAELLVARGAVRRLIISRLPVGHTHEDIDSKFALIWKAARAKHIATMQAYKDIITTALSSQQMPCDVIDLYAIPDYASLIEPCMDQNFGRYAKLELTVLQFSFEATPICADFPTGVKAMYRHYSADNVVEIVEDSKVELGFAQQHSRVDWFPKATDAHPAGFYLLSELPSGESHPESFIEGSRSQLETVLRKVSSHYSPPSASANGSSIRPVGNPNRLYGDSIVAEWHDFADNIAPESDDAVEYCAKFPLHIPLRALLFNNALPRPPPARVIPLVDQIAAPAMTTRDSITWSRRGERRRKLHSARAPVDADDNYNSQDDESDECEEPLDYVALTEAQHKKHKSLFKYVGRSFYDIDDAGLQFEGTVNAVVMEKFSKVPCFVYSETGATDQEEPQYIFAQSAIDDCTWPAPLRTESKSSSSARKSKWVGWAEVNSDDDLSAVPLLDQSVILHNKRRQRLNSSSDA